MRSSKPPNPPTRTSQGRCRIPPSVYRKADCQSAAGCQPALQDKASWYFEAIGSILYRVLALYGERARLVSILFRRDTIHPDFSCMLRIGGYFMNSRFLAEIGRAHV